MTTYALSSYFTLSFPDLKSVVKSLMEKRRAGGEAWDGDTEVGDVNPDLFYTPSKETPILLCLCCARYNWVGR